LIQLAIVSGQPFLDLLQWHPRDLDTLQEHYEEQASEARMDEARRRLRG
jgi:hypothetical protein